MKLKNSPKHIKNLKQSFFEDNGIFSIFDQSLYFSTKMYHLMKAAVRRKKC